MCGRFRPVSNRLNDSVGVVYGRSIVDGSASGAHFFLAKREHARIEQFWWSDQDWSSVHGSLEAPDRRALRRVGEMVDGAHAGTALT